MLEQILARFGDTAAAFWATHGGAELDLRLEVDGQVIRFEIKRTDRPSTTRPMHSALADLELFDNTRDLFFRSPFQSSIDEGRHLGSGHRLARAEP